MNIIREKSATKFFLTKSRQHRSNNLRTLFFFFIFFFTFILPDHFHSPVSLFSLVSSYQKFYPRPFLHYASSSNRSRGAAEQQGERADWEANHALLSITLIKTQLSTLLGFYVTCRAIRVVLFFLSSCPRLPMFPPRSLCLRPFVYLSTYAIACVSYFLRKSWLPPTTWI